MSGIERRTMACGAQISKYGILAGKPRKRYLADTPKKGDIF